MGEGAEEEALVGEAALEQLAARAGLEGGAAALDGEARALVEEVGRPPPPPQPLPPPPQPRQGPAPPHLTVSPGPPSRPPLPTLPLRLSESPPICQGP